ncbi:MAG TPA: transposase [Streptosporangiaceae bacterium]|nr:transposase [Streptosporangiaceae bacterium]
MLPDTVPLVPASLMTLLAVFAPLFTAPSFRTFSMLACGFLAQSGKRTVCGMLTGAGLSRLWPHDRAHYFFSRARWNPDDLGIAAARLVIALLVPDGEPVEVLIDDTLVRRRGKKVWAASWFHDGSAQGPAKTGFGNNWVVLAVCVRLPFMSRPVAVPVMAKLVIKGTTSASRLWLARRMVTGLAAELPGRRISVTADSAYAGEELKQLPGGVTWTTRLRSNAALHDLPPERTGQRGRPRRKGDRLPALAKIAAAAEFSQVTVTRYGRTETIAVHAFTCLWYSVTGTAPVTVILIRDRSRAGCDLALVTTEKNPDIARVIERYAARWAIEVAIEDSKQLFGTGQARNRTARAVERTVPFMLACQAIAVCWYATAGHHAADAEARRLDSPWYTSKTEPSTADMTAKLRRVIIAARFKRVCADQPEPAEIHAIRLAWEDAEDLAA